MKTADQYHDEFRTNGADVRAVEKVIIAMLEEFEEICVARKVEKDQAMFSILSELSQKFRAFASRARLGDGRTINPEAFKLFVKKHLPDEYNDWMRPVAQKIRQRV